MAKNHNIGIHMKREEADRANWDIYDDYEYNKPFSLNGLY